MSDEELDRQAALLMASVAEAFEDAEPALELTQEAIAGTPAGPTDAALEELKTEVLSAVRGAITDVMSRHQPPLPEPDLDLDLDFSLREPPDMPQADFEPESGLDATPAPDLETGLGPQALAEPPATDIEPGWGSELLLAELPAAPAEPADPQRLVMPMPMDPAMVPILAPLAVLPVPVKLPEAAARRRVPGWTAAALLSMSGIAVGAGAAILLVDPNATAQFRERVYEKVSSVFAVPGGQTEAASEAALNEGASGEVRDAELATTGSLEATTATEAPSTGTEATSAPPEAASTGNEIASSESEATSTAAETPSSGTELADLSPDDLPSVLDPAAPLPYSIEPTPVEARTPIGAKYTGAPVIALAPIAPEPMPVAPPAVADAVALSRAVRVATASDTAAFARAFEPPADVSITFNAARNITSLDTLAALPAPDVVANAEESGTATGSSAGKLLTVTEPVQVEPVIVTKPAQPEAEPIEAEIMAAAEPAALEAEPPAGDESSEPATPLSAMARANEALRKGDVEKARMLLQSESEAGQVEAMLVLARSFDPSYLKELGIASSKGDAATAEKLYRAWYDQSVKLGLVSEGINLNRLIRAMAKVKP